MAQALVPYQPQPVTDYAEPGVIRQEGYDPKTDDDLQKLIRWYEDAEQSQHIAREKAERDRDYVDNKQLTQDEVDRLLKRGQPPIALNVIRSRAAFLAGMEKKQRRDPKAYPRNNPEDTPAAEAFTDGMRYVVERSDYASKRSQAWKNIIVEGFGAVEIAAVQQRDGSYDFVLTRIPWDRAFYDPHSSEPDFSDARYFGQVVWMDYDDALARAQSNGYVNDADAQQILDAAIATATSPGKGRTYDDKPRWQVWADAQRKRVRIVMMWHKEPDGWKYCEFTNSGKIAYAEGPYVDQDGDSYCPWIFESANVDRENNRYGEIRHLIDPQDEINKRRSKALHLLNVNGVIADKGAVDDINGARRELAKPDFWLEKNLGKSLEVVKGTDLASGQAQLGAEAMNYVMQAGPNAALLGKGTEDQSGVAIQAQQAGGLVEQSDLMDTLRRLDWRVFNIIASMMKQFWDQETWIRVTDDEQAPRWVGLNEPMYQQAAPGPFGPQPMGEPLPASQWKALLAKGHDPGQLVPAVHPQTGEPMRSNDVARLDMDIIVSDAPAMITMDPQNYAAFLQLLGMKLPPPALKLAIEMDPAIPSKVKQKLQDMVEQMAQAPVPPGVQQMEALKIEKAEAEIVETRSAAYMNLAAGEASLAKAGHFVAEVPPPPGIAEGWGAPANMAPSAPMPPPQAGPPDGPTGPAPHPMLPPPDGQTPSPPQAGPPGPQVLPPGNSPVAAMTRPEAA